MKQLSVKPMLINEVGPYALLTNSKIICISALYLAYLDVLGKRNADLYKIAYNNISKDEISKQLLDLIKTKTKRFGSEHFKANALDFSIRNYLDPRFSNSNIFLSELITNLLDIQKSDVVFDFGSGTGAFLAYIACYLDDPLIRHDLRGAEISGEDYNLSKMVLEMCGAKYSVSNIDVLRAELDSKEKSYDKGYVFPPIGLRPDATSYKLNKIYKDLLNNRTSSEWAFVLKALEGLKDNGRLVALLPDSALFKASDSEVRRYLLENHLLEGIISLPANAFNENSSKLSLVVISRGNKEFKYVDGEELLKDLPVKGLNSEEASKDLLVAYNRQNVKRYGLKNVEDVHYNLSLNSIIDDEVDDSLPELGKVADVLRGCNMTLSNFKDEIFDGESGYQILTSSDIQENGTIDFDKLYYIGGDKKYDRFVIQKGDVVITSKSTRVKVASIEEQPKKKVVVTGGMIIIRPHNDNLVGTYLKLFFDSEKGRKALSSIQKGSVIVTISFENLLRMRIDLPPKPEQERVASEYRKIAEKYEKAKKELLYLERDINDYVNKSVR